MKKKTLIILACCNRKRPDGEEGLCWRRKDSVISRLSSEAGERLLESRLKLSRRFNYADGRDLGCYKDESVPMMRAFDRYNGNLYGRIDDAQWHSLVQTDHVAVLIVSALYGLLTPFESIREYNLTMRAAMAYRLSLSRWWVNQGLGSHLKEYVVRNEITEVHNFLSSSYVAISESLYSLRPQVKIRFYRYSGLGSGSDYHRGRDINNLLKRLLR